MKSIIYIELYITIISWEVFLIKPRNDFSFLTNKKEGVYSYLYFERVDKFKLTRWS
jgi:hypothetical protein